MLDKLTLAAFEVHQGETFDLLLPENQKIELRLFEVKSWGTAPTEDKGRPQEVSRQETFSLIFQGSGEWVVNQGMYTLSNAAMGTLDALFLVPIAEDENGRYYEAVFN